VLLLPLDPWLTEISLLVPAPRADRIRLADLPPSPSFSFNRTNACLASPRRHCIMSSYTLLFSLNALSIAPYIMGIYGSSSRCWCLLSLGFFDGVGCRGLFGVFSCFFFFFFLFFFLFSFFGDNASCSETLIGLLGV